MIIVSGTVSLDPANTDTFLAALKPLVDATRAEDGNVSYGFYADPFETGTYRIFEEWENQAAVDAHMEADHMSAFMGQMGDFGVTSIDLHSYQGSDKTKFM